MFASSPQTETRSRPSTEWLAAILICVGVAAFVAGRHQLESERRALVERRLAGAAEILSGPAVDVLARGGSREEFLALLRDLGATTGLRITLIAPGGEALADSEVAGSLPNLGDRPEVRAANASGVATAARKSAVTGKETVYVARSVEVDGKRLGTIRAATDASAVSEVLNGAEWFFAAAAATALALGLVLGLRFQRKPRALVDVDQPDVADSDGGRRRAA